MSRDELFAMRRSFEDALAGYESPDLYGVGYLDEDAWRFPVTNADGQHRLPAAVLARVLGYRSGTRTLAMSRKQLVEAVELLAPAEACTEMAHPNLWSWRELLERQRRPGFRRGLHGRPIAGRD